MNWQRSFNGSVAAVCGRRGRHSQSAATIRCRGLLMFGLLILNVLFAASARADVAPGSSPYTPIVTRNVFGLVPIPTNPPVVAGPPETPPPKITPNGIMTLFGKLQVLFKVAGVAHPGQPPKDESYVLSEGDRQDDIEVQSIDEKSSMITFDNHGVVQKLSLVEGKASAGDVPAAGPNFPRPGMSAPSMAPGAGGNTPIGFGGRFGRMRTLPGNTPSADGAPGLGGGATTPTAANGLQEQITPEAQVILLEAQRAKWQDEGNPAAKIIPPTKLTPILNAESGDGASPAGSPVPGD